MERGGRRGPQRLQPIRSREQIERGRDRVLAADEVIAARLERVERPRAFPHERRAGAGCLRSPQAIEPGGAAGREVDEHLRAGQHGPPGGRLLSILASLKRQGIVGNGDVDPPARQFVGGPGEQAEVVVVRGAEDREVDLAFGAGRRRPARRPADREVLDRLAAGAAQPVGREIELERPLAAPPSPASGVEEKRAVERSPARPSRPAPESKPRGIENHRDLPRSPAGEDPPFNGRRDPEVADLGHQRLGQLRQSRMLIRADDENEL